MQDEKEILLAVDEFLFNHATKFDMRSWYEYTLKCIRKAKKSTFFKIEPLRIRKQDIKRIQRIGDETAEKLLFTSLCLAKYYNALNPKNNNYVNTRIHHVASLANIATTKKEYISIFSLLRQRNWITAAVRCSSTNYRVTDSLMKDGGDIEITDMTDLGNQYMALTGRGFYCNKCGKFERYPKTQTANRTRKTYLYCRECRSLAAKDVKYLACADCGKKFKVLKYNCRTYLCPKCTEKRKIAEEESRIPKRRRWDDEVVDITQLVD